MNLDSLKNGLTQRFGRTGLLLQKHSPEILLAAGIVGVVATIVMASKATLKAQELVDRHNDALDAVEDETQEKAKVYVQTTFEFAKLYGPTIGVGVLSITAILASHGVMANRQVSLVAAYNLMAEGYKNYRNRVVEELGEEKDNQFHLGIREEEFVVKERNEDGKLVKSTKSVVVSDGPMPSIYARCFDNSNPNFRGDRQLNIAFLTAQERYANDLLILRGHVFLNEIYERLGFPATPEGQLVGWVLREPEEMEEERRDGYVSFGLEKPLRRADREFMEGTNDAIWLDFNVDGIMFKLI